MATAKQLAQKRETLSKAVDRARHKLFRSEIAFAEANKAYTKEEQARAKNGLPVDHGSKLAKQLDKAHKDWRNAQREYSQAARKLDRLFSSYAHHDIARAK